MTEYLIALGVIFGVNLLPAFGPPTWSVLVLFQLNFDLAPVILVPTGAVAAASGRLALATAARHLRGRFSPERLASLDAAEASLTASRSRAVAGLGLFALSPVPSAQLFIAAGLLRVPLVPLTAAFFAGRLVSYSIYVGAASVASETLGDIISDSLTSPLGIALQLLMLVLHAEARIVGTAWVVLGLGAYLLYRRRLGVDPRRLHRRGLGRPDHLPRFTRERSPRHSEAGSRSAR